MKKRMLTALLAACLSLSLAAPALAAPASVSVDEVSRAVTALGIMAGDESGDLGLSRRVTRAEFVTMAIKATPGGGQVGQAATSPYPDVPRGHWASGNVKRLYEQGVVTGVSATEFGPNLSMKRCDFVLMLYRAAGEPAVDAAGSSFGDVQADSYFASAVAWAAANGITQGKSEGVFAPYDTLSREEGFTFLYRALNALDVDHVDADPALLASFPDGSAVSDWARVPTATLVGMGVVSGGDSGLSPHGSLSRAEMAKLLDTAING